MHISEYDRAWPERFEVLSLRVQKALRALLRRVEHVGSTAVPGLAAKPIIDLDVVIASRGDLPEVIQRLAGIGYVYEGDLGIVGREAFRSPPGDVQHHLYVLEEGAAELKRHLAFRNALRENPDLQTAYATLKRTLASEHPLHSAAYTEGKTSFVVQALALINEL